MSKPVSNPFFETDFSKYMDMSKMMADFKLPGMNLEPLMAAQRKNVEMMTAVCQAACENYQSLAQRQAEMMRQCMEDCAGMMNAVMNCPTPEEKVLRQAEASKAAVDKCLANAREITETIHKCNLQAMEKVSDRMSEGLSELRGMMKPAHAA